MTAPYGKKETKDSEIYWTEDGDYRMTDHAKEILFFS